MAVLRLGRGTILEENIARTAGSIGEGVAAGAVFTLPAFVMAHAWPSFGFADAYWKSTALILVGSVLGVLFVSLVRRVLVEDPELPYPESAGGLANPQSRPDGRAGREISFLQHRLRRGDFPARRVQSLRARQGFLLQRRQIGSQHALARRRGFHAGLAGRRGFHGFRTHHQPGVFGCWIRHWSRTLRAEFFRQRDCVGLADPAADLFPRPATARLPSRRCERGQCRVAGSFHFRLALHRAARGDRRHDDGHGIYALPHAQEPAFRARQSLR